MKTLQASILVILFSIFFNIQSYSQTTYTYKKSVYPQWSLTGNAGVSFPVGQFGDNFKSGPIFGLDLSYKVNKEVGFYGDVGYSIFPDKSGGVVPDGKYIQYTIGPRYYFTARNLKSSLFLEAGIGGYTFTQEAYMLNDVYTAKYTATNFGLNAGLGGILNLGRDVDMLFKVKYHDILTPDGSTSFIEPVLGVDVRF